jgi:hypothetical protein
MLADFSPVRQNYDLWSSKQYAKPFKHKLNPTAEQELLLERTVTLCRPIYNAAIAERRDA